MAPTPTHIFFTEKYIGIGEDHNGAHAFNFLNQEHVGNLSEYLKDKSSVKVWYEGPTVQAKSRSYLNFLEQLKKYKSDNDLKFSVTEVGWEVGFRLPKQVDYTNILLGAEPDQYIQILGSQLNGKQTLAEAFVKSRGIKGSQSTPITMKDLVDCLSDGSTPSDILIEMQKPNSATQQIVRKIYGGGYSAMRAKYYEGTAGAFTSSSIYKRVQSVNELRDKHLANKMKREGGIFLAGDGHIQYVSRYL